MPTFPFKEALEYRDLQDDGLTVDEIAKRTGKAAAKVQERLRLFNCDPAILKRCDGDFDYVAQELARIDDYAGQRKVLRAWEARPDKSNWGIKFLKGLVADQLVKRVTLTTTEAEREFVKAHKAPAPAPVVPKLVAKRILDKPEVGQMVRMYLDHSEVGAGDRGYLVVEIGEKQVILYQPSMLKQVKVDRAEFDRYAKPYKSGANVVEIIDRNANTFERLSKPGAVLYYDVRASVKARKLAQMALAA